MDKRISQKGNCRAICPHFISLSLVIFSILKQSLNHNAKNKFIVTGEAERRKLFRTTTSQEVRLLNGNDTPSGSTPAASGEGSADGSNDSTHPAMFACIMRRRTVMNDIRWDH